MIEDLAESGALGATAWATRQLVREVKRHRSALAADGERVRSVVLAALDELTEGWSYIDRAHAGPAKDAIATRAAEQLATAVPLLTVDDKALLFQVRDAQASTLLSIGHLSEDVAANLTAKIALLNRLLGATK